jgi:TPR repeat protein
MPAPTPAPAVAKSEGSSDKRVELQRLEASARSGNYTNQFKLRMVYAAGRDVEQDDFAARKWLTLAAEQGYATAQWQLGLRLADSRTIIHDNERAVHWLRRAADQDVSDAPYQLGQMYFQGACGARNANT